MTGYQSMTHDQPWSYTVHRLLVLGAVALTLPLTSIGAQANPDSVKLRNDCRLAAQVIRTGQPAPKLQWSWDLIPGCPEAGDVAAVALRRLRTDSDPAHFSNVSIVGFNVHDAELFSTALDVAGDHGASTAARAISFRLLVHQLTADRDVTYGELTRSDTISGCPLGWLEDRGVPITLAPLSADAAARATAVASSVAENSQEPEVVRIAANCVTRGVRQ